MLKVILGLKVHKDLLAKLENLALLGRKGRKDLLGRKGRKGHKAYQAHQVMKWDRKGRKDLLGLQEGRKGRKGLMGPRVLLAHKGPLGQLVHQVLKDRKDLLGLLATMLHTHLQVKPQYLAHF